MISPEQSLTPSLLREVLGIKDFASLQKIDWIFTKCDSLEGGALDFCEQLRSLTLINTTLQFWTSRSFQTVKLTLEHLNLSCQKISYIPKLDLPNLTDLFLHNNSIKKIEGLNGCLRLKKIHLYGNYIQDICGLSNLGLLKELWLQNNSISRISGVSCLSNLRCFYLAGNQIDSFKDIEVLQMIPKLREISFQDIHFGCCPLVRDTGYRHYIIQNFDQVTVLDNIMITERDRSFMIELADEQYRQHSEQVEQIQLEARRRLNVIDRELKRLASVDMKEELQLMHVVNEFEVLIREFIKKVDNRTEEQLQLHENNAKALEKKLLFIQETFCKKMDERILLEHTTSIKCKEGLNLLESFEINKRNQSLLIRSLQYGNEHLSNKKTIDNSPFFFQLLHDHLPDFSAAKMFFLRDQHIMEDSKNNLLNILQIYRVLPRKVGKNRNFLQHQNAHWENAKDSEGFNQKMYHYGSAADSENFLRSITETFELKIEENQRFYLFSDPYLALQMDEVRGGIKRTESNSIDENSYDNSNETCLLSNSDGEHMFVFCDVDLKPKETNIIHLDQAPSSQIEFTSLCETCSKDQMTTIFSYPINTCEKITRGYILNINKDLLTHTTTPELHILAYLKEEHSILSNFDQRKLNEIVEDICAINQELNSSNFIDVVFSEYKEKIETENKTFLESMFNGLQMEQASKGKDIDSEMRSIMKRIMQTQDKLSKVLGQQDFVFDTIFDKDNS